MWMLSVFVWASAAYCLAAGNVTAAGRPFKGFTLITEIRVSEQEG